MDNNWTVKQTKELFNAAHSASKMGQGLSKAFKALSAQSGKSVNSVRNYYYSQLKMFELFPQLARDLEIPIVRNKRRNFVLFSEAEIDTLISTILTEKAKGISVRATISRLANDEPKTALRLQNKYRSTITHHQQRVTRIMHDLAAKNIPHFNPYLKSVNQNSNLSLQKLNEFLTSLDAEKLAKLLNSADKLS